MRLTALINFKYGGKWLKAGDSFDADAKYARTLIALRQANAAKAKVAAPAPAPAPAVGEARPAPKAESPKAKPSKRGEYSTRRMRAKD